MNRISVFSLAVGVLLAGFAFGQGMAGMPGMGMANSAATAPVTQPAAQVFTCIMHPEIMQDHPGKCPTCGMDLVPVVKTSATAASMPAAAVDLANTVCPVSGAKVGDSKLFEVYEGKIYHLCCADCPPEFKKDPAKFAKLVAAAPAIYGVRK